MLVKAISCVICGRPIGYSPYRKYLSLMYLNKHVICHYNQSLSLVKYNQSLSLVKQDKTEVK